MPRLADRTLFVTGAASGIGRATALSEIAKTLAEAVTYISFDMLIFLA